MVSCIYHGWMSESYIDSTCDLNSNVLDTKMSTEKQTEENLAGMMQETVTSWELKDPVSVTDNASNISKACMLCK